MRKDRFRRERVPVALILVGSLLSSYVVGLPILVLGMILALRPRV